MIDGLYLLPEPRRVTAGEGTLPLPRTGSIAIPRELYELVRWFQPHVQRTGLNWQPVTGGDATLTLTPQESDNPQAYQLVIDADGIHITGAPQGIFYGLCTLRQLLMQRTDALPYMTIDDYPDYPARGVMLDISRDRVPTMAHLKNLIDLLACLKVNQLQLYTEHTYAYRDHEIVWENASPLAAADILEIDSYCQARFIELVPNQNSLGHVERWLKFDDYRHMAEAPDGFTGPRGEFRSPSTLCPLDSASFEFVTSLYDELLPNFSSELFNVGCDEPWELGQGRSKSAVEERGGRVYLDWLQKLHGAVTRRGRKMQFWGDIIMHYPELVPELPDDVITMEWGYEANHDFDGHCAIYAQAGAAFYVCPGTSSWNTLLGRTENAKDNMRLAASAGLKHGAIGFLNTDWGDSGHMQPPSVSYLPFAYGAAVSWCLEANESVDLAAAGSNLIFEDGSGIMGQVVYDLGNIYRLIGPEYINGQLLAYALWGDPEQMERRIKGFEKWGDAPADVSADALNRAIREMDDLLERLQQHQSRLTDAALICDEMAHAAAFLKHGARFMLLALHDTGSAAEQLRDLERLIPRQRELWLQRSRRGGLEDSIKRLDNLRNYYLSRV